MKGIWLILFVIGLLAPSRAWCGSGSYLHRTDGKPDELALNVDLRVNGDKLDNYKPLFIAASRLLYNATKRQIKISKVTFFPNCHGDQSDIWIEDGQGAASNTGDFGHPGTLIGLTQLHKTVGESKTRGELGLVHELGHHLFALLDEYRDKKGNEGTGAMCVKVAVASSSVPAASIMDGGSEDGQKNQRAEFCTSANHNTGQTEQDSPRMVGSKLLVDTDDWTFLRAKMEDHFGVKLMDPSSLKDLSPEGFGDDPELKMGSCGLWAAVAIDKSGSMSPLAVERKTDQIDSKIRAFLGAESSPIASAKEGADTFIRLLDKEDTAGVVEVGGTVDSLSFRKMETDKKFQLLESLPAIHPSGKAGWPELLSGAFKHLSSQDTSPRDASHVGNEVILLLSDGQQSPEGEQAAADLLSSIKQRGVVVHAVGIANSDAAGLRRAVEETGGNYLSAGSPTEVNAAVMTILAGMQSRGILEAKQGTIKGNDRLDLPIFVDVATQAGQVNLQLTWTGSGNDLSLELTNPEGRPVTTRDENADEVNSFDQRIRRFWIDRPKAGPWKVAILNSSSSPREFAFQAHSVATGLATAAYAEKAVVLVSEPLVLKTSVRTDHPVAGALVIADIERPDGVHRTVTLFDDGALGHRDERANDGVYSNLFRDYSGSGTYNVEVMVDSVGGKTVSPEDRGNGFEPQVVNRFVRKMRFSVVVQDAPN